MESNKQTNKQTERNSEEQRGAAPDHQAFLVFPAQNVQTAIIGVGQKTWPKKTRVQRQYNVSFSQDFVSSCCVPAVSLLKTNVFIRPVLYRHSLSLSHYVTHSSLFTLTRTARWLIKYHSGIEPLQAVALFFLPSFKSKTNYSLPEGLRGALSDVLHFHYSLFYLY